LYQAEEEETCNLFCYIITALFFLYAAPQRRPLPSSRR
jgi:hypothetical protein